MKTAAVAWLVKQQNADGTWDRDIPGGLIRGGPTALAVLALLESGLKADDATVKQGLKYLRSLKSEGTYVVSLQTQALCLASPKEDAELIRANVKWLERTANHDGAGRLIGWSYGNGRNAADNSNTGYAVAGLYAAHKAGFKVERAALWDEIRELFLRTQLANGSWGYTANDGAARNTMTCSALACLARADEVSGKKRDDVAAATKKGFAWFDANYRVENGTFQFYYLDVLAQMGAMSEKAKFGDHDWRREGTEWLAKKQQADGRFPSDGGVNIPAIDVAFALRFLRERD